MEEKRQFLAANGYYIRKLNQAYFAFHGSYADTAGSIDPIGPKLDRPPQAERVVEAVRRAGAGDPVRGGAGRGDQRRAKSARAASRSARRFAGGDASLL